MGTKILIAEDDTDIRGLLRLYHLALTPQRALAVFPKTERTSSGTRTRRNTNFKRAPAYLHIGNET